MKVEERCPQHDLLIVLGQLEMAVDKCDGRQRGSFQPDLEPRLSSLRKALYHRAD